MEFLRPVVIYSQEGRTCSVCALNNLSIRQIAEHINLKTGQSWIISANDFPDGSKNGSACGYQTDRKHYLFDRI